MEITEHDQKRLNVAQPSNDNNESCWLDLVPADLHRRVALHATGGSRNKTAFCLAQTSEKQKMAVLAALEFRLCICSNDPWLEQWVNLFDGHLQELFMRSGASSDAKIDEETARRLIMQPTLKKCSFHHVEGQFLRLICDRSWEDVKVELGINWLHGWRRAVKIVSVTAPWHVDFRGAMLEQYGTLANLPDTTFDRLVSAFENVKVFTCSFDLRGFGDKWWSRFLAQLPRSIELRIASTGYYCRPAGLSHANFQSVRLRGLLDGIRSAAQFGTGVTELRIEAAFPKRDLSEARLRVLPRLFPQLQSLEMTVRHGNEIYLCDLLQGLPCLRELRLRWHRLKSFDDEGYAYPLCAPEAVPTAIGACPQITVLSLECVRLTKSDVHSILDILMPGLKELSLCVYDRMEVTFDMVISVLLKLSKQCAGLERLHLLLDSDHYGEALGPRKTEAESLAMSHISWREWAQRLEYAVKRLKRMAPKASVELRGSIFEKISEARGSRLAHYGFVQKWCGRSICLVWSGASRL